MKYANYLFISYLWINGPVGSLTGIYIGSFMRVKSISHHPIGGRISFFHQWLGRWH